MAVEWVVKFTDHSYWNTINNWFELYRLGVRAVVLRASSGGSYIDPKFKPYYVGAKAVGLKVLAYHVSHPLYTAEANIANFRNAIAGYPLDGKPVLDCQMTGGMSYSVVRDRNKTMFYLLKAAYGGVINYTAKWFWDPVMGVTGWAKEFRLWVANYYDSLAGTLWPAPTSYANAIPQDYIGQEPFAWQFSAKGLFPSVSPGDMDKSVGYTKFAQSVFTDVPTPPSSSDCLKMRVLYDTSVRGGPGITYPIIGSVAAGTEVDVLGVGGSDSWIDTGSGKWVAVKTGGKVYCEKI
jgi:GH25 family lysozyme M1 (1,4-beta-N-acetylmuramidase)